MIIHMKASSLIARICEDYTTADKTTVKESENYVNLIFSWSEGEIITYRILRKFYDTNLRSIFSPDPKKDSFFKLSKVTS